MKISLLKTALLCFAICAISLSYGQWNEAKHPEGVTVESEFQLKSSNRFAAFFFKDKTGRFWVGYGGSAPVVSSNNNGLISIKNNIWKEHSNSIFTGYVERGDSIIFSATDGLHYFRNETFKKDTRNINIRDLVIHKGKLIAASVGKGLLIENATGFESVVLQNQGISYDSIYSLFSDGEELWIGTNKGLIRVLGEVNNQSIILKVESANIPDIESVTVRDVVKDKYGRVWFLGHSAPQNRFVYIYDKNQVKTIGELFTSVCHYSINTPEKIALTFHLNKKGNVMIQTNEEIYEFALKTIELYRVTFYPRVGNTKQFPQSHVIYSDRADVLYAIDPDLTKGNRWVKMVKLEFNRYSIVNLPKNINFPFNLSDINNVKSSIKGSGLHLSSLINYWLPEQPKAFHIPDIGCAFPLFVGTLWMGGIEANSNQLHVAAETYRQSGNDFISGPIELASDLEKRLEYDKVWKVNKKTIDYFIEHRADPNYEMPKEILEWPGNLDGFPNKPMAPFVDLNNNGLYEPHLGDYPKIKGDQMFWWVFNDLLFHSETQGEVLGVEVHGSCYAYFDSKLHSSHPDAIVNRTLIFSYKVFNYSNNDYKDFKMGIYNSFSLGNFSDDRIGCDTINNASFVYNATNIDNDYAGNIYNPSYHGYGQNPPIFFCKFLNQKMTNHMTYNNNFDPITGNPNNATHYYNLLNSKRKNGSKLKVGGDGLQGDVETNYIYPGAICGDTGWTEMSGNVLPGSKRSVTSTGIDLFQKDSVFELEFAYIMLHDPNVDFLVEECDKPSKVLQKVQHWYDTDSFPSNPSEEILFAKNAEWHYDVSQGYWHLALQHYTHIADTTIDGKAVRIVEEELKNNNGDYSLSKLYFHEEGDTVYLYNFEKQKFLRFLVFNVPVGGVFELDIVEGFELHPDSVQSYTVKIENVETRFFNGVPCKEYSANLFVSGGGLYKFIDRMGWMSGFYPVLVPQTANWHGGLRCYSDNDIDTNFSNVSCNFMFGVSVPTVKTQLTLNVYPNPATDILNIELNTDNTDFDIVLMGTDGRVLHRAQNQHQVDISSFSSGMYYLILKTDSQTQVRKWIKL